MELKSKLIYPNPFKPIGIEFTLDASGKLTLEILDHDGVTIETPISTKAYEAGRHTVELGFPLNHDAGYYRISVSNESGHTSRTYKLILK